MMNDSINNKIFLYITLLVNIVFVFLIAQEAIKYNENTAYINKIQLIEKDLQILDDNANYKNIQQTKERYNKFYPNFNTENRLQDLLGFIENTTLRHSLIIQDVQFPVSNETESISKVTLKGSIENYYKFVADLENDASLKEILGSKIEMVSGSPILFLEIRSYKF